MKTTLFLITTLFITTITFSQTSKKHELKILANNKIYKANWIIITKAMHYGGAFKLTNDTNIFDKKSELLINRLGKFENSINKWSNKNIFFKIFIKSNKRYVK